MINLSAVSFAIDRLARPLVLGVKSAVISTDPDTYGDTIQGVATLSTIRGAIQPKQGTEMKDLPEGIRAEAGYLLWTRSQVQLDNTIKDGASTYRVLFVWERREGGFTRAALGLLA